MSQSFVQVDLLWVRNQQLHTATDTFDVCDSKIGDLILCRIRDQRYVKTGTDGRRDDDMTAAESYDEVYCSSFPALDLGSGEQHSKLVGNRTELRNLVADDELSVEASRLATGVKHHDHRATGDRFDLGASRPKPSEEISLFARVSIEHLQCTVAPIVVTEGLG